MAVRRLLRQMGQPHRLTCNPLAALLQEDFRTQSLQEAVARLIDRTFVGGRENERLRDILVRMDLRGQKAVMAASSMNLSLRTFFRCRAEAIEALAQAIEESERERVRDGGKPTPVYCANCRKPINPLTQ